MHLPKLLMRLLAGVLVTCILTGCATSKWMKTRRVNLAPFAEQTIAIVGQLNYRVSQEELLYLRNMIDYMGGPQFLDRYRGLEEQVVRMLKGMVAYSLQVVAISEQEISAQKKVNALADMIVALETPVLENNVVPFPVSREEFDAVIANVRSSETYLQALQESTPLINKFQEHAGNVLDEADAELLSLSIKVSNAIDRKYLSTREYFEEWRQVRDDYYDALTQLSKYAATRDQAYLNQAKKSSLIVIRESLRDKNRLTGPQLLELHKVITEEMRTVNENSEFVEADIRAYYNTIKELEDIVKNHEDGIKQIRLTFIAWNRAYSRMAAGKTDPAEWFDITDTGRLLFGAARISGGL